MQQADSIVERVVFALVTCVLLAAPWLFGVWEMWWFWPFAVGLFLATGGFALRLMFCARLGVRRLAISRVSAVAVVAYLPFLAYALTRALQADVFMDAERSFLLQFTPFLLGLIILVSFGEDRRRLLTRLLTVNFLLLALYGILNYFIGHNARVLWVPGYPQYQLDYARATGSYFCPDHFAGLMELGAALALPLLLARATSRPVRAAALALLAILLTGIVLSKSRGAGVVTAAMLVAALWIGSAAWPDRIRRYGRVAGLAALLMVGIGFVAFGGRYMHRFKAYPWQRIEDSERVQMSLAALRGWQSAPWFGIGPGMHQNLWPHFAPSPDGDRATGRWPSHPNNHYHSFEAHDDWAQLLEEYGVVGVALFFLATGTVMGLLGSAWRRRARQLAGQGTPEHPLRPADGLIPAGILALLAMAVHSIGDFNLQIPATTWLLAALVSLALAGAAQLEEDGVLPRRRRLSGPSTT